MRSTGVFRNLTNRFLPLPGPPPPPPPPSASASFGDRLGPRSATGARPLRVPLCDPGPERFIACRSPIDLWAAKCGRGLSFRAINTCARFSSLRIHRHLLPLGSFHTLALTRRISGFSLVRSPSGSRRSFLVCSVSGQGSGGLVTVVHRVKSMIGIELGRVSRGTTRFLSFPRRPRNERFRFRRGQRLLLRLKRRPIIFTAGAGPEQGLREDKARYTVSVCLKSLL